MDHGTLGLLQAVPTLTSILRVLQPLCREMEWLAEQYDPDGDGLVSLQDFMTVMQTA